MKKLFPFISIAAIFTCIISTGCGQSDKSKSTVAAEKPKVEGDLAFVTLSKKAHQSLLIKTAPIRTEEVRERLKLTGWIMAPRGNEVTLTAPVAGYVRQAKSMDAAPLEGQLVNDKQELFYIEPVLSPVEQIQMANLKRSVDGEITKAVISLDVAQKELTRAIGLRGQGLRSQQELDKAKERYTHAKEDLQAARDKQELFTLQPVPITAPRAGTVLTLHVSPGQFVASSAPLVTIADMKRLWLRVPVPEHDLPAVNHKAPVRVTLHGKKLFQKKSPDEEEVGFMATPVTVVPKVDILSHTVDLIYELSPEAVAKNNFVKDQMLQVYVPLGRKKKHSVVPYSAVVYDGHGGAWIYVDRTKKDSPQFLYQRRRIQIGPIVEGGIVIEPPAGVGDQVVTSGAGILFSREFYSPPVPGYE